MAKPKRGHKLKKLFGSLKESVKESWKEHEDFEAKKKVIRQDEELIAYRTKVKRKFRREDDDIFPNIGEIGM